MSVLKYFLSGEMYQFMVFFIFTELLTEIEALYAIFTKEKDLTVMKKSCNILIRMQCLFGRCQELGDEKIALVQQVCK